MIKRIIFDFDNTLMPWKEEYKGAIKKAILKHQIDADYRIVNKLVDDYENTVDHQDKYLLLDYINAHINNPLTIEVIDDFFLYIGEMSDVYEETNELLEYLSSKYELVVLTRWFLEPQIKRLEHADMLKYMKDVYGGDLVMKPAKEAFLKACGNYDPSECVMIGDDYNIDIEPASKCGLNVIYYNYKNKDNPGGFDSIKELKELKKIF